ncbi:MAG: T9SS type A sorting domain-containing protein [Ignavibacterium sp.]|jgi:hypothetical protein|nr:T9SS type A sorting domain-containing protein [Ignavibacterium sp.]
MKTFLRILLFFFLVTQICFAQYSEPEQTELNKIPFPHKLKLTPHIPKESAVSMHPSFYDRKSEWKTIIKNYWGPGQSTQLKLNTFDTYQTFARANNATFLWNPINWDSLASVLRSRITDSTSRGEFSRILNDLACGMRDAHCQAMDTIILSTPLNPGTPILAQGGGYINHFGAGLTPLADSTLLVYKVVPQHPLGLVPGDIILGYQGIPWHQLVRELLAGGVPHTIWFGASPSAFNRSLLWAAGENWHLFDTIDVKKFSSGEVLHLPLDTMVTLNYTDMIINNEQLPVPGVPMPVFSLFGGAVKYGIVQGTNIGYIYVYHHAYPGVSTEFDNAVKSLMETDGLILDIRLDWGGGYGLNEGISRLLNHSTYAADMMKRCSPSNFDQLCPQAGFDNFIHWDLGTYYDKPIAVLLGPNCLSYGDISSWQLSYVPNARMFGRSPAAIFSGMWFLVQPASPGYHMQCTDVTFVDHYNPGSPIWGQEYPLYEEVWLTPEGVANGQDGVVARALEWMNNLVYAHNITTNQSYYSPGSTVNILSTVENPNSHQISVRGFIETLEGSYRDSVELFKQTTAIVGELWSGNIILPDSEKIYKVSVTAFDNTEGSKFETHDAFRITTAGPLTIDSIKVYQSSSTLFTLRPYIKNNGNSLTIREAKIRLYCDDPWVWTIGSGYAPLPDITPGSTEGSSTGIIIRTIDSLYTGYFNLRSEIVIEGYEYWSEDSIQVIVGIENKISEIPTEYLLSQSYPNPFNSSCAIKYSIPKLSQVSLKIFNTLGEEIETLVNEEKPVGTYELNWNAANLPSGVYFYQLKAGDFISTKKMILLK